MLGALLTYTLIPRRNLLRWLGWFFFGNYLLLLLVGLRYLETLQLPPGSLPLLFLVLTYIGHFALLAYIPFVLVLPIVLLFPWKKVVTPVSVGLGFLLCAGIITDTVVFSQFRFHLNGMVWGFVFGDSPGEVFTLPAYTWLFVWLTVCGVVVLEFLLMLGSWRWVALPHLRPWGKIAAAFLVAAFLGGNGIFAWASATSRTPVTKLAHYIPAFAPLTMNRALEQLGLLPARDKVLLRFPESQSELSYPLREIRCRPRNPPFNLIMIIVDALRFDMLNRSVTPNMAAFAEEGWRFENHFSGGNSSRIGLFSLFYGLPGPYWHDIVREQRGPLLMRELIARHYSMGIFGAAALTSIPFDRTIFSEIKNLRTHTLAPTPLLKDQAITAEFRTFLGKMAGSGGPFFGFLYYDTPHAMTMPEEGEIPFRPYLEHFNVLELNPEFDPLPLLNRYKNGVYYVDRLVGEVLDDLKQRGFMENTVILVTGDHAQEFNDNGLGYWGHNGNFTRFQTQVPLVVHWPGKSAGRFTHRTSHNDVPPTLMTDLLGCDNDPSDYSIGKHLLNQKKRDHLLIGSYNHSAVVEHDRITLVTPYLLETYDLSYRELPGVPARMAVMLQATEEISRFYAK